MIHRFYIYESIDREPKCVGLSHSSSIARLTRSLVLKADKVFGRKKWNLVRDGSIIPKAVCGHVALTVEPF